MAGSPLLCFTIKITFQPHKKIMGGGGGGGGGEGQKMQISGLQGTKGTMGFKIGIREFGIAGSCCTVLNWEEGEIPVWIV